jgi:hypothetical protein
MVIPHHPHWFFCTSYLRLRELGCDAVTPDAALARPHNQGAASIDLELCPNLGIALALADEGEHFALARRQLGNAGGCLCR